jgi:heterodisulfide reductase subunit D
MGCEMCSRDNASFSLCADRLLLAGGKREGFIPRAFGGALDSVVSIQLSGSKQNRLGWITPELRVADVTGPDGVGLFVGCAPLYDTLLSTEIGFTATSETHAAVTLLNSIGVKPVVLGDEVCCGGDRLHASDRDSFIALGSRNRDLFRERGVKTIVTTCNDCRRTLEFRCPGRVENWDFRVVSLSDYLLEHGVDIDFMPSHECVAVQPSDRYSDPSGTDSVSKLLARIPELALETVKSAHPTTFGSWNQFGSISKQLETSLLKAAESTGADRFLMPSTRVLVRLLEGRRPGSWEETSIVIEGLYGYLAHRHAVARDFAGA